MHIYTCVYACTFFLFRVFVCVCLCMYVVVMYCAGEHPAHGTKGNTQGPFVTYINIYISCVCVWMLTCVLVCVCVFVYICVHKNICVCREIERENQQVNTIPIFHFHGILTFQNSILFKNKNVPINHFGSAAVLRTSIFPPSREAEFLKIFEWQKPTFLYMEHKKQYQTYQNNGGTCVSHFRQYLTSLAVVAWTYRGNQTWFSHALCFSMPWAFPMPLGFSMPLGAHSSYYYYYYFYY